jgi:hypothetical protein
MLDEVIASRTERQADSRRVARNLQRIARLTAIPAAALMLFGLISFGLSDAPAFDGFSRSGIPLRYLFSPTTLSPLGAMSVGLLGLACLPIVSVLYILIDSLVHRYWANAGAAGAVAAVLILGIVLGHA